MIDTTTYTCFLALLPPEQWPRDWRGRRHEGEHRRPFLGYERIIKHSVLAIRLFICAGMVVEVGVDLPKLLYGPYGRLRKTRLNLSTLMILFDTRHGRWVGV